MQPAAGIIGNVYLIVVLPPLVPVAVPAKLMVALPPTTLQLPPAVAQV